MVENIVEKGENASHQHFPLFLTIFSKAIFPWVVKIWDCMLKGAG